MTSGSIRVCRDARAPHWQLGPLPPARGRLTLIAWSPATATNDSGVPPDIARTLARAWTSIARVTFASSTSIGTTQEWTVHDDGLVRRLTAPGLFDRAMVRLRGAPIEATLVCTRQIEVAARLFEDPAFPWWLQGQVVLLSDPGKEPPNLDEPMLHSLFDDDWAERGAALRVIAVQAIVRPAVDGDLAGLLSLDEEFDRRQLDALERETRAANLTWSHVSEQTLGH